MLLRRRPKINQVFNSVTRPHPGVYAARTDALDSLQDRVARTLKQPGKHLVLFGFTGVGKTSLLEHVAGKLRMPCLTVQASRPLDERSAAEVLLGNALADLGFESAVQVERKGEGGSSLSVGLGKNKAGISAKDSRAVTSAIQAHSLDTALARALVASRYRLLFVDAFEFVPANDRRMVVQVLQRLMHELSDMASSNSDTPKIVVAGVADATGELIPADGPVARRIEQVRVPPMGRNQLKEILERGGKLLRLDFDEDAAEAIINASDGFPYYTHHFALHAVEQARLRADGRVRTVNLEDYQLSLEAAISLAHLQLARSYLGAVQPGPGYQTRKLVLEAVAALERRVVSTNEIRDSYLALNPLDENATHSGFFQGPLSDLSQGYPLLREISQNDNSAHLYSFRDPLMRAYVRLHREHPSLIAFHRDQILAG